jgi:hypothetical protein
MNHGSSNSYLRTHYQVRIAPIRELSYDLSSIQ